MPETQTYWLLLGPWHTRYRPATDAVHGLHRLVAVTAPGGRATRVVTWSRLPHSRSVHHIDAHGTTTPAAETLTYRQLTLAVDEQASPEDMPLALLAPDVHGWAIFVPIRLGEGDALFHRVDTVPGPADRTGHPAPSALMQTLENLPAYSKIVGSHECWYFKHDPDAEYEHKFTLDPATDIYRLARDIKSRIGHGELARYRAEYRNDFELWQFGNHMFDVTGPRDTDRGYASFIPRLNGGYTIKRKRFARDGFRRIEHKIHWPRDRATLTDMHAHLTHEVGIDAHYLGGFDRIRFDDMLESSETGHIYSLMTDRCDFHGHQTPLHQLEIEYIRSRGDTRDCAEEIVAELDHLKAWTEGFLIAHQVIYTAGYTSKHTHLLRVLGTAT